MFQVILQIGNQEFIYEIKAASHDKAVAYAAWQHTMETGEIPLPGGPLQWVEVRVM